MMRAIVCVLVLTGMVTVSAAAQPPSNGRWQVTLTLQKAADGRWLIVTDMDNRNS